MKFARLTHESFLLYAIKAYENPNCTTAEEFKKDLKVFAYLSKFLNKSGGADIPKYRLFLNHIITLKNLFGNVPTARMLFFYFPERHHPTIKTALAYLHSLPAKVPEADIENTPDDPRLLEFLRTI